MHVYVSIEENNNTHIWLPNPNEQYNAPPTDAICWISGNNDAELLHHAINKFTKLGFEIMDAQFYQPAPGGRGIKLIVKQRTTSEELQIGNSTLGREAIIQAVSG